MCCTFAAREKTEYAQKPCRLETESGFTYYHLPVTGGGGIPESLESVADAYLKMIDGQMERIICAILKAESNVLYFCGAGKDRTGVVSAKRRFAGIVTVSIHKELMD